MADSAICAAQGCDKLPYLGKLCGMHRTRMSRHGTLGLPLRKSTRKPLMTILEGVTVFGDLTVVDEADGTHVPGNGTPRLLLCRCVCGSEKLYPIANVKRGLSTGCGCKMAEKVSASKVQHGQAVKDQITPEYRAWAHAIGRCENPNDKAYANYGGRGIFMCQRWRDSFESFFEDMGPRPKGMSIDRIDVNGGYEPGNCRWATKHTQDRNRRTNRMLSLSGRTQCLNDWARELGMHRSTIERRLKRGLSDEAALTGKV